jgi:hypothetical protein
MNREVDISMILKTSKRGREKKLMNKAAVRQAVYKQMVLV